MRREWLAGMPAVTSLSVQRALNGLRKSVLGVWGQIQRLCKGVLTIQGSRRLKVAETVSLGEKRFVSILHVDGEQFLLGGSVSSVVVLARLEQPSTPREPFGSVLLREDETRQQSGNHVSDQTSEPGR